MIGKFLRPPWMPRFLTPLQMVVLAYRGRRCKLQTEVSDSLSRCERPCIGPRVGDIRQRRDLQGILVEASGRRGGLCLSTL